MNTEIDQQVDISAHVPDGAVIKAEAKLVLESYQQIEIDDDSLYAFYADEVRTILKSADDLEAKRLSLTRPLDATKKGIMDFFREPIQQRRDAAELIKKALQAYQRKQQEIAAEQQRIADEAARVERERLEAEAEAARQEAAKAQQELEELQARTSPKDALVRVLGNDEQVEEANLNAADAEIEASLKASDLRSRIANAAANAESSKTMAVMTTAPTISVTTPVARGIGSRVTWAAEVVDKVAFIKHALTDPALLASVEITMKDLNKMAAAQREHFAIPGLKAVATESMAVRRR